MDPPPVIDVSALIGSSIGPSAGPGEGEVAAAIDAACRSTGFFAITGHGVDPALARRLQRVARAFFVLPPSDRAEITMARGGRAWRGWFPPGGELTSGAADRKEGIYFGAELPDDDPRVRARLPLHGANVFPSRVPALQPAVLDWIDAMTALGHRLARGLALGLGLEADWFDRHLTADPLVLFRIFRYPAVDTDLEAATSAWGVAEHTDYGLLTILLQDDTGGLEVNTPEGWVDVPVVADALVCNLGDMLDRMTGGRYRSTPHRVRAPEGRDRLSFPFFFDPSWDAVVQPIPLPGPAPADDVDERWDGSSVRQLSGTYGDYLWSKVGRVFPELQRAVTDAT